MNLNVVVNAVIINDQGKVLIAQRASNDNHEPGKWTTPGGTLEAEGEQFSIIEKTLRREVKEEVGVEIKEGMRLITNNTFVKSNGNSILSIVFLCRYKSGKARPLDETDRVKWVTKEELRNYEFPPNVREYLEKGLVFN